jgi:hypothetical protein
MSQEPFVSLSSLESDLRNRIEGEVRELEGRRARLERDARAADEFVRRVSSMLPGPNAAALALFPSLAAARAAAAALPPVYAAPLEPAPAPREAPALRLAPTAAPSSSMIPVARPSRASALAGTAALVAVAMSFVALFVSTGHRAEIATANAAELAPPAPRVTSCMDGSDANRRSASATASLQGTASPNNASSVAPVPAPSPATSAPVAPAAAGAAPGAPQGAPLGTAQQGRPLAPLAPLAGRIASAAPRARAVIDGAPKSAAPGAAPAVAPPTEGAPKLDDAARTASLLREQLANTLR